MTGDADHPNRRTKHQDSQGLSSGSRSAVNGRDGYFGNDLDALTDCLRGGFGTPEDEPYEFNWQHSDLSRRHLREEMREPAAFVDAVRDVFDDAGVPLHLR